MQIDYACYEETKEKELAEEPKVLQKIISDSDSPFASHEFQKLMDENILYMIW